MASVVLRTPRGTDCATLVGKIDTGADLCAVPSGIIESLGLPPLRLVRAAGFGGELRQVEVVLAELQLGDVWYSPIEAIATLRPYVIVGRNVLRHLVLRVDGPGETFELKTKMPPKRRARG